MKKSNKPKDMKSTSTILTISAAAILLFSSCEHRVETKTTVHEDGSIDKTITLYKNKSAPNEKNYFNVSSANGWKVSADSVTKRNSGDSSLSKKYSYTFQKSFKSVEEANAELAMPSDSLFHITSKFKKQFRWFYTYYYYSEIYHPLNRFSLPTADYLTKVDFEFIRQLPAEGGKISKADSLFLKKLNERIFDEYGPRALFEEFFESLLSFSDGRHIENIRKNKENLYKAFTNDATGYNFFADNGSGKSFDIISSKMADSLGIDKNSNKYQSTLKRLESKIDFIGWAKEGKFQHCTEMNGEIVEHNADSTAGNRYYWSPAYLKFAFENYDMHVTTRKPNLWAWGITILLLGLTAWRITKRKIS
ncbi:MAG: hypothetical protein ACKO96_31010 [Flammeovirgaceae bacterium]